MHLFIYHDGFTRKTIQVMSLLQPSFTLSLDNKLRHTSWIKYQGTKPGCKEPQTPRQFIKMIPSSLDLERDIAQSKRGTLLVVWQTQASVYPFMSFLANILRLFAAAMQHSTGYTPSSIINQCYAGGSHRATTITLKHRSNLWAIYWQQLYWS